MKKSYLILSIILIVLTAINLWVLLSRTSRLSEEKQHSCKGNCYVSAKISLDDKQKEQYQQIKSRYQDKAILIADSLHISQEKLMSEMIKGSRDSLRLEELEERISSCQKRLLQLSVEQYFEIKSILTPAQIPALDKLFAQILICRPTCNHRDDDAGTIPHLE